MAIIIPKITGSLTTKTVGAQSPSDFTKVDKSIQGAADQASKVSEVFRQGIITEQISKQTISVNQQLNELSNTTLQDPNLTESSGAEYHANASKILEEAMNGIGDPVATRQFQVQNQSVILARTNDVRKAGRTQQIDRYGVQTNEIKSQSLSNSFITNNPVNQAIERNTYVNQLNRGVDNLWLSRVNRQEAIAQYDEERRVGKPQHDFNILTAPGEGVTWGDRSKGAEEFIQQVRAGVYAGLTPQEQTDFITKAESFRDVSTKRDQLAIEARQFTKWQEVLPKIKSGEMTEPELRLLNFSQEAGKDDGEISDSDFNKGLGFLNSVKGVNVKTDNGVYHEIHKKIYGSERNPKTGDFYTHEEISDIIDDSYLSLDEEDMQGLIGENTAERRSQTKLEIAAASKGLEARITQQVLRSDDILFGVVDPKTGKIVKSGVVQGDVTAAKAAKAIADEYMARFDREVSKEKLKGDDIERLERKIEDQFLKENGLFFGKGATPHVSVPIQGEVKRHFRDTDIVNAEKQFTLTPVEPKIENAEAQ